MLWPWRSARLLWHPLQKQFRRWLTLLSISLLSRFLLDPDQGQFCYLSCNNCYCIVMIVPWSIEWSAMSKSKPWLMLLHQIPPKPDALRVRVWRALQKIGALQLKNSVYVLPSDTKNKSKFETVLGEIVSGKGDAFLCEAQFIQGIDSGEIIAHFNVDRSERYRRLADELRELQRLFLKTKPTESDLMGVEHSIGKLERQLTELKELDFFNCDEQKPTCKLLDEILSRLRNLRTGELPSPKKMDLVDFQEKVWVTRSGVRIDRVACAWLIAKYIDRRPTFKFVSESDYKPKKNEVRFDMFDGEFTHIGDRCSMEVLVDSFSLKDQSIRVLAEIIHDLDLKDTKFNRAETPGIGMVIEGIVKSEQKDKGRIKKASAIFDDLIGTLKK
ncbi:MAG: ChrB protein [Bdellovibrio sp.]|nr:MAG: ChrB protein [Bdellovibrio sp.]